MPPARSRPPPPQDDSRSEASSTKEKAASYSTAAVNGKSRRTAGNAAAGSSLRDVVTAESNGNGNGNGNSSGATEGTQGVCFQSGGLTRMADVNFCLDPMVNIRPRDPPRLSTRLQTKHTSSL